MITIKVLEATLCLNADIFSNIDAFVQITVGSKKYKTRTVKRSSFQPQFGDIFANVPFKSLEDRIHIKCFDEEFLFNELLGDTECTISELLDYTRDHAKWFYLDKDDITTATVLLEAKLQSEELT